MGYFRILYYISYIFNTLSRIIRRHGKFLLWFICIFVFLFFTMYTTRSHAAYEGDYSYGDPNYAFDQIYDQVCLRWLKRFDQMEENDYKEAVRDLVKDKRGKIYFYYGGGASPNGESMMNQFNYDDSIYYFAYIPSDTRCWTRALNSDTYMSIPNISCSTLTYRNPNIRLLL